MRQGVEGSRRGRYVSESMVAIYMVMSVAKHDLEHRKSMCVLYCCDDGGLSSRNSVQAIVSAVNNHLGNLGLAMSL
jgi:hypothetical protein